MLRAVPLALVVLLVAAAGAAPHAAAASPAPLAAAASPAPLAAAASPAPRWLGVVADGPLTEPGRVPDGEWDGLAASGAGGVRTAFFWPAAQPRRGATDLSALDATVLAAARRRLPVLPVVYGTPAWATADPAHPALPASGRAAYAAFLRALVARYGPRGTLWAEHRDVPRTPIRDWQVWNEPNLAAYWGGRTWARDYVRLLKVAHRALERADRGSRTILAGLPNDSWKALAAVYDAGGRRWFDAVALHPYTGKPRNVLRLVEYARREMRRAHDSARKPIWITELSWPAAEGRTHGTAGFETTDAGQASRLRDALRLLAAHRRAERIERVYWYTWLSEETPGGSSFTYSGLRRLRGGALVDAPALAVFRGEARRLSGR